MEKLKITQKKICYSGIHILINYIFLFIIWQLNSKIKYIHVLPFSQKINGLQLYLQNWQWKTRDSLTNCISNRSILSFHGGINNIIYSHLFHEYS